MESKNLILNFFKKLDKWFKDIILDDVDKPHDGPLPYHKGFGIKKDPVTRIENRFNEQKKQNRG